MSSSDVWFYRQLWTPTVPANLPSFALYGATALVDSAAPPAQLFERESGAEVALDFKQPAPLVVSASPTSPMQPGSAYRLSWNGCYGPTTFDFTAAEPIPFPTTLGTVTTVTAEVRYNYQYGSFYFDAEGQLSSEMVPWAPYFDFTASLDGVESYGSADTQYGKLEAWTSGRCDALPAAAARVVRVVATFGAEPSLQLEALAPALTFDCPPPDPVTQPSDEPPATEQDPSFRDPDQNNPGGLGCTTSAALDGAPWAALAALALLSRRQPRRLRSPSR